MFSDECAALPTTINPPTCFFQVYFSSLFASYDFVPVLRCVGNCRIIYSDLSQSYCLERPKSRECKIAIFYFQSKGKGKMSVNCEPWIAPDATQLDQFICNRCLGQTKIWNRFVAVLFFTYGMINLDPQILYRSK